MGFQQANKPKNDNKKENLVRNSPANKEGGERAGKPPQGGSGVPDDTRKNDSGSGDLDSHGQSHGAGGGEINE